MTTNKNTTTTTQPGYGFYRMTYEMGKEHIHITHKNGVIRQITYAEAKEELWDFPMEESDTIFEFQEDCEKIIACFRAQEVTIDEAIDWLESIHDALLDTLLDDLVERALQLRYYYQFDPNSQFVIDIEFISEYNYSGSLRETILNMLYEENDDDDDSIEDTDEL